MTPKSILWRGAFAALMMGMLTLTASSPVTAQQAQQQRECKEEKLNAAGKSKFRPFTQAREIRGEGAAMADAIYNWQRNVLTKYGAQWMLWEVADDKSFYCGPAGTGPIGHLFIGCTIEARPCNGGPPTGEEPPDPPERQCSNFPPRRILEAQQRMNGCNACGRQLNVDGQCGPQTERCLRDFQASRFGRQQGLEVNGLPDGKTMNALREYCERG